MSSIASLGLWLTCLLAVYVFVRTLLIGRRTRQMPELMIGPNVLSVANAGIRMTTRLIDPETSSARSIAYAMLRLVGRTSLVWECHRGGRMVRTCAAIGLGDPMASNRFWLWGVGVLSACCIRTIGESHGA